MGILLNTLESCSHNYNTVIPHEHDTCSLKVHDKVTLDEQKSFFKKKANIYIIFMCI